MESCWGYYHPAQWVAFAYRGPIPWAHDSKSTILRFESGSVPGASCCQFQEERKVVLLADRSIYGG